MRSAKACVRFAIALVVAVGAIALFFAWGQPSALAVPVNDDFPGTAIDAVPFAGTIDTTGATLEEDEPVPSCYPMTSSVWFSFTSQETAVYVLDVKGQANFQPIVVLYEESSFPGGGLAEKACAPYSLDEGDGPHTSVPFQADAGETYFAQLGGTDPGFGGSQPPFDETGTAAISLMKAAPPSNDDVADAEVVVGHFVTTVDLTGATTEPDEPGTTCFEYPFFAGEVSNTAWYKYTAPQSGAVLIEPLDTGSLSFAYPAMVVWKGTPGDFTEAACGFVAGFEATAGETYYIQVGELQLGDGYFAPGQAIVKFALEPHDMPTCSGAEWSFSDPPNDLVDLYSFPGDAPGPSPDVIEVRASSNAEWACLTLKFANQIEPNTTDPTKVIQAEVLIDTDQSRDTGQYIDPSDPCRNDAIGYEFAAYATNSRNMAAAAYQINLGTDPDVKYGFQFSTEDSITIALELEDIGNANFNVAAVTTVDYSVEDCVLNQDIITVLPPVMTRFGDVNCDAQLTPADDAEILAGGAGVEVPHHPGCAPVGTLLPSEYAIPASGSTLLAGDIDCDTLVTPLDALALLREIAHVPGPRPAGCPVVGDAPLG
jgi:hypothetical protein